MTQVPVDTAFELLSNSRRRFVLSTVRKRDEPVELSELSAAVAAHEAGISTEAVDAAEQKRVYVSLYQSHIPKLESAGFVEYDPDCRTVETGTAVRAVDDYLGPVEPAVRWQRLTGGLSVLSVSLLVGATLGAPAVSPSLLLVVTVSAVLSVTVAQYLDHRRRRNSRPPELQIQ